MSTLVDRSIFRNAQLLGGRVDSTLFEKVVDLVARVEKVAVTNVRFFAALVVRSGECRERVVLQREVGDEVFTVREEWGRIEERGQKEVAVPMELGYLVWGEDATRGVLVRR